MYQSTFQEVPPRLPVVSRNEWPLERLNTEPIFPVVIAGLFVDSLNINLTESPASFADVPPVFWATADERVGAVTSAVMVFVVTAVVEGELALRMIASAGRMTVN